MRPVVVPGVEGDSRAGKARGRCTRHVAAPAMVCSTMDEQTKCTNNFTCAIITIIKIIKMQILKIKIK